MFIIYMLYFIIYHIIIIVILYLYAFKQVLNTVAEIVLVADNWTSTI